MSAWLELLNAQDGLSCEGEFCGQPIAEGEKFMLSDGQAYCLPCGQCKRFEETRALARQEKESQDGICH